jgi:PPK2 family polyphosphate:nucleotide phosphotransferase
MFSQYRIKPGTKVRLKDYDPNDDGGMQREAAKAEVAALKKRLDELQEELYAAGQHSALIVLQGRDTSGKDGTIRKVFGDVNPAGCRVEPFKVPTAEELAHDFLWRVHKVTPRKGMMAIFNRSHYEDVLVVRVHKLAPKKVIEQRYEVINQFERFLASENTIILKFFLHISKDEQEQRLLEREQDPRTAWKLAVGDWKERSYWDAYTEAYELALARCSTDAAPWIVVPANRKWYRDLVVAQTVVTTLEAYRKDWAKTLRAMSEARRAELDAYRAELAAAAAGNGAQG